MKMIEKNLDINTSLVSFLIKEQFPQYSDLEIAPVTQQGHDNRTYHLGNNMLVRLPSGKDYAAKVQIEQQWLPKLSPHISLKIPKPLYLGKPSQNYPFHWSIYEWISGTSLNLIDRGKLQPEEIAKDLALFIKELHKIDIKNAPLAGKHNFHRGCHISIYAKQTLENINKLQDVIDSKKALSIWQKATESKWQKDPVWIHGDLAIGNILMEEKKVKAIIDFGGMAIGDPACDLVIYWNFFAGKSKDIFKSELNLDQDSWNRARGWALWKACFATTESKNKNDYQQWLNILENILNIN